MANVVVARKPLLVDGTQLAPGDVVDPTALPPQRMKQLINHGYAYESKSGTTSVSDKAPAGKANEGNGFSCDECGKVLKSPQGVKIHQSRIHGGN